MDELSKVIGQAEWTTHAWYETSGGDRVALMQRDGSWAVSYSYTAPHSPQFIDLGQVSGGVARRQYELSQQSAHMAGRITYEQRSEWLDDPEPQA